MTELVRVTNVVKRYKRGAETVSVLDGLSVTVNSGEFLALMGPSGSGKSTLLNMIGGIDRPDEGSIEVGGERIDQLSRSQLSRWRAEHVGFIFQMYNLLPVLTAEKNVELAVAFNEARQGRPAQPGANRA